MGSWELRAGRGAPTAFLCQEDGAVPFFADRPEELRESVEELH